MAGELREPDAGGWARTVDGVARPEGLPLLADAHEGRGASLDLATIGWDAPALSAIVIARNNAATIERTVRSVTTQVCDAPFEVIVAASGDDATLDVVRRAFPDVVAVEVAEPGLPGMARNAGLAVARGEFVSLPRLARRVAAGKPPGAHRCA